VTTLAEYEIPPEALPTVVEVWQKTQEWNWKKPLSIREAKWVSRLSYAIKDLETLCCLAVEYAVIEVIIRDAESFPVDPLLDAKLYSIMTGLDTKYRYREREWSMPVHKKPTEGYDILRERTNLPPVKVKKRRYHYIPNLDREMVIKGIKAAKEAKVNEKEVYNERPHSQQRKP